MEDLPPINKIQEAFPGLENLEEIARGGFKVVFKAQIQKKTEIFKIVKLPDMGKTEEHKAYRSECLGRIRREVELLGKCKRPEIVKLGSVAPRTEVIEDEEYIGYSEEYLEGEDLWVILRRRGQKPDEEEAKCLLLALLRAIKELWVDHKMIHRDIKPANIIKLENDDRPFVLLDLGIAFGLAESALTADTGRVPATPRYLAPEMARPDFRRNLDFRADIYTAALTVFEYSSQIHPLAKTHDDLIQTISRALHQPPRKLKTERPDFSDSFCELIDQMLKKRPMLRPSNLGALISEMEAHQ